MEHPEQNSKSKEVIDRTDRADDGHELPDEPDLPSLRPLHHGGVNFVARNADLRDIIKKIVQQYLAWEHGQEWQEE